MKNGGRYRSPGKAGSRLTALVVLLLSVSFFSVTCFSAAVSINCDDSGHQVFLDGIPFSYTPVDSTVDLDSGYHFVSFFNHEMNRSPIPFQDKKNMKKLLDLSTQSFLLTDGDSISVILSWGPIENEYRQWHAERRFARFTGGGFLFVAFIMFVTLTGF